jgi:hypothetical protein
MALRMEGIRRKSEEQSTQELKPQGREVVMPASPPCGQNQDTGKAL